MIEAIKFLKSRKSITVIIQTTLSCNLRCKHCYEGDCQHYREIMSLATLEDIIAKTQYQYLDVNYLWFGGEPLLAGVSFFKKAIELQQKYKSLDHKIRNSVQTNGVILDKFIDFFIENNFHVSVSYDCQFNEVLRQKSDIVLKNIDLCANKGLKINLLSVLHKDNYLHQKEMCDFLINRQIDAKFNRIFCSGTAVKNQQFLIGDDEFLKSQKNEFIRWISTESQFLHPFFKPLLNLVFKNNTIECVYSACLFKRVSFSPNGDMMTCPRFSGSEYTFGNISQIENIYEVFANSKYLDLASKAIERKKKCKQECSLYPICNGGCNANFYDESDITSNDSWFCRFNRSFLPWMIGTIHEFYQKRKIKNGALLKLCNEHFENLISVSKSIGLGEL
ncbi:MAG: radical SAM protein [Bacilli bacterium]|nr:radical SAM protein [Bacilli bacterium]